MLIQEPVLPAITDLVNEVEHISDVRIGKDRAEIFRLSSRDGVGEILRIDPGGRSAKKISDQANVRGSVGYGGGGFDIRGENIVFCDKSGAIYQKKINTVESVKEIVPGFLRTCSPKISPDGKWVLFVFEQNEVNGIGISASNGLQWPRQFARGADFYMHPAWHPQGGMVAWVEWDHPHMPWDASRIKLGHVGDIQRQLVEEEYIDGENHRSANQPVFSPDGRWLSYIIRHGEWDDLVLYNLATKEKKTAIRGNGFHLRMPDWIQGLHSYQWTPDSSAIYFIKYHQGTASLGTVDLKTGKESTVTVDPYVWISQIDLSGDGKTGVCIGMTETSGETVVEIDLSSNKIREQANSEVSGLKDKPELVTFANRDGHTGYAWFFPAKTEREGQGPAPCIIKIHSGPTSVKHAGYSPETAFFRSRGFSVAHINYRGSVSFGYRYQYALEHQWGIAEVEDTLDLIDALVSSGKISKQRMAVMGSSAGGLSVLQLLIQHPGLFKAAICSYAVSDLVDDAKNTHKFEKYYHRFLTGNYPEEEALFIERSPITHISRIKDPVALFHGEDDPVVSVRQSEQIIAELTKNSIPSSLTLFAGEGHGFRKTENIETYYQTILSFLNRYL